MIALRIILRVNTVTGMIVIALDALIAFLLSVVCVALVNFSLARGTLSVSVSFGKATYEMLAFADYFLGTTLRDLVEEASGPFMFFRTLFGSTTLIPTLSYLFLLAVMIIAKPVGEVGRRVSLYFLERATEDDARSLIAFSLVGTVFSVFTALIKLVDHLVG